SSDIEILDSNISYGRFNKKWGICDASAIEKELESELQDALGLQEVFDKLAKALCYVNEMPGSNSFYDERCNYLYYWMGDILVTNLKDKTLFSGVIDILYQTLSKFIVTNACTRISSNTDKDVFKKMKLVYDYSQNYNGIMKSLGDRNNLCNKDYHNYLNETVNAYKEMYNSCKEPKDTYCDLFKDIFETSKYESLSSLKCKVQEDPSNHLRASGVRSNSDEARIHMGDSQQSGIVSREGGPQQYQLGGTFVTEELNDSSSLFMYAIFPLIGMTLICFVLYRFTPLVSWIREYLIRKKVIKRDIEDTGTDEIIEIFSEGKHTNSGRKLLNITYNSSRIPYF
ncbi:PIR protein, partial [Plasmodium ovale]